MIDTPTISTTEARDTALIHLTIPRSEVQTVMGPGLNEVMTAMAAQGIEPAGPWLTHHVRMDPKVFDFEICVPVKKPLRPAGRVKPGRMPAMTVARTTYHGGYEGLGAAWAELSDWMNAQGLAPAPDLWEVYTSGPESGSDPSRWRTELNKPLLEETP